MTLHVYRISPDGARTDLGTEEITATEPYDGFGPAYELPCRCARCIPANSDRPDSTGAVA
ncbi:hypothetical protein C7C46_25150 [Streptomyces tateyamensis]|uniref:Uncharacterized protein n=2 Tax=Streptomyces tateyamensis TaxID=565073 RepID=A0A2V4MWN8_9ACTN|nr:hypothetical protein C7C46_25150 [Streptomyces tateyamensis]